MTKIRIFLTLVTFAVVAVFGWFAILYARGYRLDTKTFKFQPKGILVVKSNPTGAQIFVDRILKGATDSNFSLSPGIYDIDIKKNGYLPWYKRITIEKEAVTQIDILLFKSAPSLAPVTQNGAEEPVASPDMTKIAYADATGLWLIESLSFPIGFSREPKQVTDANLAGAAWEFSPSARQILLTSASNAYLLETGAFTPQTKMINVASKKKEILESWQEQYRDKLALQEKNLPDQLRDILEKKTSNVSFSPDEARILYTASASASLSPDLIPAIPGASTQAQNRTITIDHTYVYDIKEDRNFLVDAISPQPNRKIFWLENNNLVLAEESEVIIMDYDGTNRQTVFSGNYIFPNVFPYINSSKLLILTNLGSSSTPNLYSLSIK